MSYILFFDSGIGGLSVLREAIKLHPEENYIFFADEANLPYGDKDIEKVRDLTLDAMLKLREKYDLRAIVVSCNTATSAAITTLRHIFQGIPVIGIEPAVKPACERHQGGKIGVLATKVTLSGKKFTELCKKHERDAKIIPIAAPGLVELIETDDDDKAELERYLDGLFENYKNGLDCIVLGCTHYPFVKDSIIKASGCNDVIDGSQGTVMNLFRQLGDDLERGGERIYLTSANSDDFPKRVNKFLSK